ncbi:MAG TPA: hypothetical protein VFV61_02195 [Pyrinomonadaceae bacterium]|nr:hypothetical protein [Pyrinomonadaceae bacterium]
MKRLILLVLCLGFLAACSKATQQNQSAAQPQSTPKYFYFVRKIDGKVSPLPPDLGEFKGAQRVEGEIIGSIVQKTSGPQEKTKDGSKYIYTYFVCQGKDIEMIDNAGLYHAIGTKESLLVANIEKPDVPDMEFLQVGLDPKSGGMPKLPSGGTMTHLTFETSKQAPSTLRILGEFRWDKQASQLLTTIRVKTDAGETDIPVNQLIPYRKKAEPSPSPAK